MPGLILALLLQVANCDSETSALNKRACLAIEAIDEELAKHPDAPTACTATTDVPELKAGIKRACKVGLVSIDISGDRDTLIETLVLDRDLGGRDLSAMPDRALGDPNMTAATLAGFSAAMESAQILDGLYHSRRFIWRVRDRAGRALCHFTVTDEETIGRCAERP